MGFDATPDSISGTWVGERFSSSSCFNVDLAEDLRFDEVFVEDLRFDEMDLLV